MKKNYVITPQEEGKTIAQLLREKGFTKKQISRQKFVPEGILLDGRQVRVSEHPRAGQVLALELSDPEAAAAAQMKSAPEAAAQMKSAPETAAQMKSAPMAAAQKTVPAASAVRTVAVPESWICYEDADLLAVGKPPGLVCHTGRGHYTDNLGSMVEAYLAGKGEHARIRLIGRLDRDTSGLVVFAKNQAAASRLWKQKEQGLFQKCYQVLVWGEVQPEKGVIELPLDRIPGEKNKMQVCRDGKYARTEYCVAGRVRVDEMPATWLSCRIKTGRTHQIRVHMAATGHPVAGDVLYGKQDRADRLYLHAGEMSLYQPFTGEKICLRMPFLPGTESGCTCSAAGIGHEDAAGLSHDNAAGIRLADNSAWLSAHFFPGG